MKQIFSIAILLMLSLAAQAQSQTKRADTRQKAQRVRIADGRQDGELTNREAAALNKQQRHIRRTERRVKADGVVTPQEKMKLERKHLTERKLLRYLKLSSQLLVQSVSQ